jgi:hypothetical protein
MSSRICLPCVQSSSATMTESGESLIESKPRNVLVLKLKGTRKQSITWAADTVNNENMGKKSSKREHFVRKSCRVCRYAEINRTNRFFLFLGCCIFHRKKKFAESDSDESDSDTEIAKASASKSSKTKAYQRHHA